MKTSRKIRYLWYFLFLFHPALSQEFWEEVNMPSSVNIRSVVCTSNSDIYIGINYSTGGGLYKTSDNGVNWELLGFEDCGIGGLEINELGYIYACVYSHGTKIQRSLDGGLTWEVLYQALGGNMIKSFPGGVVFACVGTSTSFKLIRSVDYGAIWEEVFLFSPTEYPYAIAIKSADTIYMGTIKFTGDGGGVYCSMDGGDTWENIGLIDHYVSSLALNASGDLFAGTRGHYSLYQGGVYVLPEGETEWEELNSNELVTSMAINSEDKIYIGCSGLDGWEGGVRCSSDNGQTWEDLSRETMYTRDIDVLTLGSDGYLYALEYNPATASSILYKSIHSTMTSLQEVEGNDHVITYNFPNPFSDATTICLELPPSNCRQAEIAIYTVSGDKIAQIHCPVSSSGGTHSVTWYPRGLPSGVYYYKLTVGSVYTFHKMVLQR